MKCRYKNIVRALDFYVVNASAPAALSLKACKELSLIKVVMAVDSEDGRQTDSSDQLLDEFEDVFTGQGCIQGEYSIQLKPEVNPVVHAARKVPVALKEKVQEELNRMEKLNIITKVDEPTAWVNSMVVVPKPNGTVRICLDPKDLNAAINREHYKMPTMEEITCQLADARWFTVLDATSGYWVVPLSKESSKLTTFHTPYGRYRYLRMPFGICSAQEVFQKKMDGIFEGMPGVHVMVDDILIAGSTKAEHDERLRATLNRARESGIKFNPKKLQRCSTEVKFFGELLTKDGLKPDPAKVIAVRNMTPPKSKKELECQLGMFTYLAQYSPHLSQKTSILRELVKKEAEWSWCPEHERAFAEIKSIITEVPGPVLQYYDPAKPVKVQVDASQTGLGAVIMQDGKPIAYASKALTATQQAYAQIEKETLAIVFGCEKFHHYLYGRDFVAETDHKPLEIIMKKPLHLVPMRLQRMRIRLQRYNVTVQYKQGKNIPVADTLSRSGARDDTSISDDDLGVDVYVNVLLKQMPVSDEKLDEIRKATKEDSELQQLQNYVKEGWPTRLKQTPVQIQPYWNYRDEITVVDGILYKGQKIVIPKQLRAEMLRKIHTGHMGVQKCKERARDIIFWPGMSKEIENQVARCPTCQEYQPAQQKQPLLPHEIPLRPWQRVATDLFVWNNANYLVLVDYFSNYFEIAQLANTKSATVIHHTKSIFARHGIPEVVISDNGPQYSSQEYDHFAKTWGFQHKTSSPTYPQSNGLAERTVQTVKNLLKKALASGQDPYLSILCYRNTPLKDMGSPAQLLMNRRLRTDLPTSHKQLRPQLTDHRRTMKAMEERKLRQKQYYDLSTRSLKPLHKDESVRLYQKGKWEPAVVISPTENTPRSYRVQTPDGSTFRRNRKHLLQIPSSERYAPSSEAEHHSPTTENLVEKQQPSNEQGTMLPIQIPTQDPDSGQVTTRSGRVIKKPKRFTDYMCN